MDIVTVDSNGGCVLPSSVAPGPYEMEVTQGVITLHPLVRASSLSAGTSSSADSRRHEPAVGNDAAPTRRDRAVPGRRSRDREYKGRSWSRVPAGTPLTGPGDIGVVRMGSGGDLHNGRTPNQHLTDHGITANAWQVFKLDDGRPAGVAYDAGEWS